ncbi:MAG TPA: sigma-70 family RNA polymerase sigma factor [Thermoanaerobaculia bacterium]|jgi:RNA polymerase sigma factor (sigma-70 family)|nr:sigma-70 family RNA polymerase sigma factor [Thermoanaerobaculia bacterium]
MEGPPTRLQKFIEELGLKVSDIVGEANRIAAEEGVESISRQHFLSLRQGHATATAEKIYIIVAAIRSATGMLVQATDLFVLQPAAPKAGVFPWERSWPRPEPVSFPRGTSGGLWSTGRSVTDPSPPTNESEFEALYIEYGVILRSIAIRRYSIPPDDAEALVHDIFTAYLQRREQVRELKGWLIGAIGSGSKDYLRRRKREEPLLPEHDEKPDQAAEKEAERWMLNMTVARVLARLGEHCRETLRRYYFHEESKESIAEQRPTSPAYVLQLLVSCRRRVRELYDAMRSNERSLWG